MPENSTRVRTATIILSIITLVLLVLAAVGYYYRGSLLALVLHEPKVEYVTARPFAPHGTIYLTLASATTTGQSGIYAFDLATNTLKPVLGDATHSYITARPGTPNSLLYVAIPNKSGYVVPQVYTMGTAGKQEPITSSSVLRKRAPVYSPALDAYIYSGATTTATVMTPNWYGVYLVKDGKESYIGQGALPALTPKGTSVVVLRNDGLYLLDLTSKASQRIWAKPASLRDQFSLSLAGDSIAWAFPEESIIQVESVSSWAPFAGALKTQIQAHANWPTFSLDGTYLAFDETDVSATSSNPRLTIFDLKTPQKKVVQDFSAYNQAKIFVSAWQ